MPQDPEQNRPRRPLALHDRVVFARIGNFTVVSFGVFAAMGAFLAAWLILARQHQVGLPAAELRWWLVLLSPFLALVGSRLYALTLLEWRDLLDDPLAALARTTLAWQGGFVAVTAGVVALAVSRGIDPLLWIDTFAFGVPLGQALGRVGCHTYGCCHGRPTTGWPSIVVNNPASKVVWGSGLGGVPLHPVQLYSAAANLLLAGLLAAVAWTGPLPAGTIAAVYLVVDGLKRFALELLRGIPVARRAGLTPFQWFALVQAAVGLWVGAMSRGRPLADFSVGTVDALAHAASWWPACAVAGLGMLLWMGIHRGEPGSVSISRR